MRRQHQCTATSNSIKTFKSSSEEEDWSNDFLLLSLHWLICVNVSKVVLKRIVGIVLPCDDIVLISECAFPLVLLHSLCNKSLLLYIPTQFFTIKLILVSINTLLHPAEFRGNYQGIYWASFISVLIKGRMFWPWTIDQGNTIK